jgi:hypothetical protein
VRIHKWTLQSKGEQIIEMRCARILSVQEQGGNLQLWALIDEGLPLQKRVFRVFGTGQDIPSEPLRYIGTVQMDDGALVAHVFEKEAA